MGQAALFSSSGAPVPPARSPYSGAPYSGTGRRTARAAQCRTGWPAPTPRCSAPPLRWQPGRPAARPVLTAARARRRRPARSCGSQAAYRLKRYPTWIRRPGWASSRAAGCLPQDARALLTAAPEGSLVQAAGLRQTSPDSRCGRPRGRVARTGTLAHAELLPARVAPRRGGEVGRGEQQPAHDGQVALGRDRLVQHVEHQVRGRLRSV